MPNRIIRDGWVESTKIDLLDANAERFFIRLCLRADDYGRYHANPLLLKSNLFPLREDVRSADITRCLAACEKAGLLRCYNANGGRYLLIERFGQQTRAKNSKFPSPDMSLPSTCVAGAHLMRSDTESDSDTKSETDCAEPDKQASAPEVPVLIFPIVGDGDKEWPLLPSKVAEYRQSFPSLDVLGQVTKARQWCRDNPAKQKTARGMGKFLFAWLERAQNRGSAYQPNVPSLFRPASSVPDNLK